MMNILKYFNVQWKNILFRWLRQFIIYSCMLYANALNYGTIAVYFLSIVYRGIIDIRSLD